MIFCCGFRNYEVKNHMSNILIDIRKTFYSATIIKGLYKYSLKICEIFWDVRMDNGLFGRIQKHETKNGHAFYTTTENTYIYIYIPVQNLRGKFCTRLFKIKNRSKIGWEFCVTVSWCP